MKALVRFTFNSQFELTPIVVGPYYTPGCKPIASSADHFNMIQIAMSCGSPSMTSKRHKYPNFYRVRSPGDIGIFPTLKFITEIGKWNKIVVITTITNSYNFAIAKKFLNVAKHINVTVGHFDYAQDIDQMTIDRLKESELRVIALEIGQSPLVQKFLCLTYKNKLTGPRYAFFIFLTSFSHPSGLPPTSADGCTREEIMEQYRYCHFVSAQQEPLSNLVQSSTGLTADRFMEIYNSKLNYKIPADTVKRFQCHDAVSKALFSLNDAEEKLLKMNMSLKHFLREPTSVMKVVNSSVASTKISSLRTGVPMEYSSRMELDTDPQVIAHWNPDMGDLMVAYTCRMEHSDGNPMDILEYKLTQVYDFKWYTIDGVPPAQTASVKMVILQVKKSISIGIIVFTSVSSVVQLILSLAVWIRKRLSSNFLIPTCSCVLLMNMAAVTFGWSSPILPLCFIQPLLCICQLSICNYIFITGLKPKDKLARKSLTFFSSIVPLLLVLLWFLTDSIFLKQFIPNDDHYDEVKDVKYVYKSFTCFSLKFGYINWALLVAAYQVLIWLYFLHNFHWKIKAAKKATLNYWNVQQPQQIEQSQKIPLNNYRILIINNLALTTSAILIASTLHGLESSMVTIAVTLLLMSWITSVCLLVQPVFHKE